MSAARNLIGLVGVGRDDMPERTVTAAPPRRRSRDLDPAAPDVPLEPPAADPREKPAGANRPRRRQAAGKERGSDPQDLSKTTRPTTVRISVNIPLACKQWLANQAREQQRFVSEIVMEAVDRFADDVSPPSGRAKRVAVPDGAICNIVLPVAERHRLDDLVARKEATRSALLTEVFLRASMA